jgi:cyclopropane fatty-acyl-phospholipid synthase-like methyltransferase
MKKLALALSLLASPAFAQQAFVPYTIDAQTHDRIMQMLLEQPMKYSFPVVQILSQKAQEAQAAKAKEPEKK